MQLTLESIAKAFLLIRVACRSNHFILRDACEGTCRNLDNDLKLDLEAEAFSTENALYFARLSEIASNTKDEAQAILQGDDDTEHGMGFDHFYWFEGFYNGVTTIWENTVREEHGMRDIIKSLYNEQGKKRKLFITGYSLGGALATVTAAHLAFKQIINITAIHTYGSPRVFNGPLAEEFDAKINYGIPLKDKYFRCRNNNDIVPRIPSYPYTHVGTEIYIIDRLGNIVEDPSWVYSGVDRLLGRLTSKLRGDFVDGVSDHPISEYIRLFSTMVNNEKKPFCSILEAGQLGVETVQQVY